MNMKIPFMKYRKIAGTLSIIIFLASILTLTFRGLTLGLDFSGGCGRSVAELQNLFFKKYL